MVLSSRVASVVSSFSLSVGVGGVVVAVVVVLVAVGLPQWLGLHLTRRPSPRRLAAPALEVRGGLASFLQTTVWRCVYGSA